MAGEDLTVSAEDLFTLGPDIALAVGFEGGCTDAQRSTYLGALAAGETVEDAIWRALFAAEARQG